jgi:zinc protease
VRLLYCMTGKTGLAHFLEHLLFRGTKRFPAGQFEALMDENGVEKNAFTTHDITAYYERGAKDLLPLFMDLEADRMKNLVLDAAIFEVERKVVQEERRQRIDGDPSGAPMEEMSAALFGAHPYGRPVIGTPEDVASESVDDVIAFYRNYYQPNRATLLVVGDVVPADVRKFVEQFYGVLTNDGARAVAPDRAIPAIAAPAKIAHKDPRFGAPVLVRRYLAPSLGTSTPAERAALDVLGMVLSGHPKSRMERELVQQKGVATWASAGYQGMAEKFGQFFVYASPSRSSNLADLEVSVDGILAGLVKDGLTQEELVLPKKLARASFIYSLDDLAGVGTNLGIGVVMGAEMADLLQRDAQIEKVTVADVNAVARKLFGSKQYVTMQLSVQ